MYPKGCSLAFEALMKEKICADAQSVVPATSPVLGAQNIAPTVLPKCIANRRLPTPEKRGRA